MKLVKNGESGQVLIIVLILVALGPLLIVPMLNQGFTGQKYHQIIESDTLTTYAADAGIEYGYCEVYNNVADIAASPLEEILVINDATVNVTAEYIPSVGAYKISSKATGTNNRSTTIVSYVIIDIGLFGNAFACDGNLQVNQTELASSESGECDVYANGNITLNQSSVDGDVTAAGTVDPHQSTITGTITEHAEVLDFPEIDPQPHMDAALEGGTSGSITWNKASDKTLGPKYINGNLNVNKTNVTLTGTVYVTGTVSITQSNFSGFGDIVAIDSITMTHYDFIVDNPDILPLLMTINGNINLTQSESTYGTKAVLYAPNGTISLSQVEVYGAVAANTIIVNQAQVFYPASVKGRPDLPGAGMKAISYGYQ